MSRLPHLTAGLLTALLPAAASLAGCASDPIRPIIVPAVAETDPMRGAGDRADDPAIWVHPGDPAQSLILGTNKDEGLYVYGLDGRERQRLPVGLSNNVDLRGNLAVASNDGVNALSWFRIDPATRGVAHVGETPLARREPYGVCMGRVAGQLLAAVTFKDGVLDLWEVDDAGGGLPVIRGLRSTSLGSQIEGCVIDDRNARLFVGEENVGLWALDLASLRFTAVDAIADGGGLVADVEGVSLYASADGSGFILVSAQAKDRYVVYDRAPPHRRRGVIAIGPSPDGRIDGVSHTDGLDIAAQSLPGFPEGLLVVQDDANPDAERDQNFKLVDWREIRRALERPQD